MNVVHELILLAGRKRLMDFGKIVVLRVKVGYRHSDCLCSGCSRGGLGD